MVHFAKLRCSGRAMAGLAPSWPVILILLILLEQICLSTWSSRRMQSIGLDFYQFWLPGQVAPLVRGTNIYSAQGRLIVERTAQTVNQGRSNPASRLYKVQEARRNLELFSTPLLYSFFHAIATGDYDRDLLVYQAVILASTAVAVIALSLIAGYPIAVGILLLITTLLLSRAAAADFIVGNVNSIQLLMLALFLLLAHWRGGLAKIAAGAVLAVAVMFKPNVFLVVPLVLLWRAFRGQWREVVLLCIGGALGAGLSVFASMRLFPPIEWVHWGANLSNLMSSSVINLTSGNASLMQMIQDHGGPNLSSAIMAVLMAAACAALVWSSRTVPGSATPRPGDSGRLDLLAVGLGCVIPLLSLRLVWFHYYDLCLPLLIATLFPHDMAHTVPVQRTLRALAAIVALVLVFSTPIETLLHPTLNVVAIEMYVGALLLFALGCWSLIADFGKPAAG